MLLIPKIEETKQERGKKEKERKEREEEAMQGAEKKRKHKTKPCHYYFRELRDEKELDT